MRLTDFEYAIKKDVRNNPIVREVDRARQRELWRWGWIAMFLVAVLLFSAFQHFQYLSHGYVVERLREQRAAAVQINRQLKLELETLRSPKRIEKLAIEKLRLVHPAHGATIVIERVTAPKAPDSSVVASR